MSNIVTTPTIQTQPPTVSDAPIVEIDGLTVAYNEGTVHAVNGLSLTVMPGEVLGLLGGNGAGKTSTMRVLAGVLPATGGRVCVDGHSLNDLAEAEHARALLGYCPDTGGLIRQATVREHIGTALALRGMTHLWPYAMDLIAQFDLGDVLDRSTSGFSHGMSRRLSVLLAALTAQRVLILDEPFDGVDPQGVETTKALIAHAKNAGLAVIVSTHLLSLLSEVSDRVVVMVKGQLVADEPASTFRGKQGSARYARLLEGGSRG